MYSYPFFLSPTPHSLNWHIFRVLCWLKSYINFYFFLSNYTIYQKESSATDFLLTRNNFYNISTGKKRRCLASMRCSHHQFLENNHRGIGWMRFWCLNTQFMKGDFYVYFQFYWLIPWIILFLKPCVHVSSFKTMLPEAW